MKYVIIGNSIAAVGAVESIRKYDSVGEITIIGEEKHHVYARPLISYLLMGKTTQEKMKYRPGEFYQKNNCSLILGERAVSFSQNKKEVLLQCGEKISYDKLLVATGSLPFVPPMEGMEKVKKKFSFMSLDDALSLQKNVTKESNVLIIGAGLIGLKCAEGIQSLVKSISIVDLSTKILSSILDDDSSKQVQSFLEGKDISFYLGNSVQRFEEHMAYCKNGEKIPFDVCVLAVGVKPRTELIKEAGGDMERGICVNTRMETSIPDVYAAGDCAQGYDLCINKERILALLPNAYFQGECAGANMAGQKYEFTKGMPMNSIGFFGLHIATAGIYEGEVYESNEEGDYKKLFFRDNLLKGYILIGNIEKAGIYTSLIREKTKLDSIDFELICEKPGLMAFAKDERQRKLSNVKMQE